MSVLGVWGMGQANDLVQQGSRWLNGTHPFRHGYVAWHEGKIVDEDGPGQGGRPAPPSATHATGAEYKIQIMVDLRCMNGEDAGTQVVFKTSSLGGTEELQRIVAVIQNRAEVMPDNVYLFPVVELKNSSYPNKKKGGGLTYNPVLDVVGWADADGNLEDGDEPNEEPAALPPQPAAPAAKAKPPIAEAGPQRRRRV